MKLIKDKNLVSKPCVFCSNSKTITTFRLIDEGKLGVYQPCCRKCFETLKTFSKIRINGIEQYINSKSFSENFENKNNEQEVRRNILKIIKEEEQ